MRTEEWFRGAPTRVQEIIAEHLERGWVDLNLIHAIGRTISDGQFSNPNVFYLARMLGYLPVGALRYLLDQAFDLLEDQTRRAREDAISLVERRMKEAVRPDDLRNPREVTVAELRDVRQGYYVRLDELAVMCDALAMAISTPEEHPSRIAY